jgi:hypothetical protein
LKQQDWQGTFGTSVLTLKSETAAAKPYMSIIGNLSNRDRIRLSELVKLLLANLGGASALQQGASIFRSAPESRPSVSRQSPSPCSRRQENVTKRSFALAFPLAMLARMRA